MSGPPQQAAVSRSGLLHAWSILRAHLSVGVLNIVQYRADFLVSVVNAVVGLGTQVLGLSVIFTNTTDLRGWTADQMLVLVGIHFFIGGLIGVVMRPSMQALMEGIRLGTFDFLLTKPADSQLLASSQVVAPQAVTDVVVGVGVLVFGVLRVGGIADVSSVLLLCLTLVAGLVIVYCFLLMLSTAAFWFVKLDNILVIFQSLFGNAGRWPVTIFPGWLRPVLTFVVPIAFAVTVPAQALTGDLPLLTAALSVGVAVAFIVASRVFWKIALKHYTGASA